MFLYECDCSIPREITQYKVAILCDPPYPLQQLRRTCVAIAFPRTAAAAEREN